MELIKAYLRGLYALDYQDEASGRASDKALGGYVLFASHLRHIILGIKRKATSLPEKIARAPDSDEQLREAAAFLLEMELDEEKRKQSS